MKIVLAPDSYKNSLSALGVANAMEAGIRCAVPDAVIEKIPMADGGEGTVDAVLAAVSGKKIPVRVHDPLGREIDSFFAVLEDRTAVIEMAAASGIELITLEERDPYRASTFGTGELMKTALDYGCRRMILGIGGSATNDGGMGMAKALGTRFLDAGGNPVGDGGGALENVARIDCSGLDARLRECEIRIACDVKNPFYGPKGATYVYGPQKGADEAALKRLDAGMKRFGDCIRRDVGVDVAELAGAGAAGGLGGGLVAFAGAKLFSGIDIMCDLSHLEEKLRGCDLVFTGEGKTDEQTAFGKVPAGIAGRAKPMGVPVVCLSGSVDDGLEVLYDVGITAVFSALDHPMTLEEAIASCAGKVEKSAENIMRLFCSRKRM